MEGDSKRNNSTYDTEPWKSSGIITSETPEYGAQGVTQEDQLKISTNKAQLINPVPFLLYITCDLPPVWAEARG